MARFDERSGNLYVTELGRVASHFYVKHNTIVIFNEALKRHMSEAEVGNLWLHDTGPPCVRSLAVLLLQFLGTRHAGISRVGGLQLPCFSCQCFRQGYPGTGTSTRGAKVYGWAPGWPFEAKISASSPFGANKLVKLRNIAMPDSTC